MTTGSAAAPRSFWIAVSLVLLGLLALWAAQPVLPGWACTASLPGTCVPHVLPVRASVITAGVLLAVLGMLVAVRAIPSSARWMDRVAHGVMVTVPVILVLTVAAHFLIPGP